jgi:lipoyl(octanoyl) transferase
MTRQCIVHWLGMVPYELAWQLQADLAAEIASGERPATLLLLEHPHTYTFGRRGQAHNLLWDEAELLQRGISVHWVDRGGDVTYHGPGQLVGYPLLPLAPGGLHVGAEQGSAHGTGVRLPRADYVGYLRRLERTLIEALDPFGITGIQVDGLTGVWVGNENKNQKTNGEAQRSEGNRNGEIAKIASIGVKVDVKGISRHGFAINVDPDMSYWEGIIGCGLEGYEETSLAELLDSAPNMQLVIQAVIASFGDHFDYRMVEQPLDNH